MPESTNNKFITVFIPTFNGEKYVGECIEAVLGQELPKGYKLELLVIDSGSSDNTLDILARYSDRITLVKIPNSEFSHGGTRDKAARLAKGEFILFLTQDATPTNYRWLINMIEPFYINDKVGCVFGRQVPRRYAAATIKREVSSVFGSLGAPDSLILHRHESLVDKTPTNSLNSFFSDANSAVRRNLLTGPVPFRQVHYAEDQALAEDMQSKGYLKAYAPLGAVWHSNEYTARQYYRRKFDEFIGLQESTGVVLYPSERSLLLGWLRPTIADWKFIVRDHEYGPRSKIKWLFWAPLYNIAQQAGRYYGIKYFNNPAMRQKISLEAKKRK